MPDCCARCLPSDVRNWIKSRSNSAMPPRTVSISLPTGLEVFAQGSASDRKAACFALVALMMLSRSLVDLANRSNRVTIRVSPDSNAFKARRSSRRSLLAPLIFSLNRRSQPWSRNCASCDSKRSLHHREERMISRDRSPVNIS